MDSSVSQVAPELSPREPLNYSFAYGKKPEKKEEEILFECNICLDTASLPVVTMCGHLYCWPCLNNWLKSGLPSSNACPVCKSGVKKENVIPIYVKGRQNDPRLETEERPSGHRNEVPPQRSFFQNGRFSVNFGVFPFGIQMVRQVNQGVGGDQRMVDDGAFFMSRMMLMLGTLLLVTIILY